MHNSEARRHEDFPIQFSSVYSKRWAPLDDEQWMFINAIRRVQTVMDALGIDNSATANLYHGDDTANDGYVYVQIGDASGRIDVITEVGHLGKTKVNSLREFVAEALALLGYQPTNSNPAVER